PPSPPHTPSAPPRPPAALGQQLVQRLLALVVAAHGARAVALFADGVDLVDKDDAGGFLGCLLEQVAHLGSAHAHEHLHKLAARADRKSTRLDSSHVSISSA